MRRYAIYYAPAEDSALTRTAASWLGRDAFHGETLPLPPVNGLARDEWLAVTADPRLYGFHATLKPPFRLAQGATAGELRRRLRDFAAAQRPFEARLELGALSRFLALVLAAGREAFSALASACVREFDEFRAPPAPAELERRRRARLTPPQLAQLERWGYPYVMDEWRFHMTLTASLDPETFARVRSHLAALFAPYCGEPVPIDSICLFEQEPEGAPFVVTERFRFA